MERLDVLQRIASLSEIPQNGLRFTYRDGPFDREGILLRLSGGSLRAYRNECRHLPIPLDERDPGTLWDREGRRLACSAHGALFQPEDGLCITGPCEGSRLRELPVIVEDGTVWLDTSGMGSFFGEG